MEATREWWLENRGDQLLTFLKYEHVPWDNNAAERAVRPMVRRRKIHRREPVGTWGAAGGHQHVVHHNAPETGQRPLSGSANPVKNIYGFSQFLSLFRIRHFRVVQNMLLCRQLFTRTL